MRKRMYTIQAVDVVLCYEVSVAYEKLPVGKFFSARREGRPTL